MAFGSVLSLSIIAVLLAPGPQPSLKSLKVRVRTLEAHLETMERITNAHAYNIVHYVIAV
jgi:hypothetical protein